MRSLYQDALELIKKHQRFAFATVIHTRGSTPQKPGAKALFLPDGKVVGTLGGGCLEAESRRRGLECLDKKEFDLLEMHLDDDFGWDDGLICGGTARVFIDPEPHLSADVFEKVLQAMEQKKRAVLATVVTSPKPELIGKHWFVRMDGEKGGTLSYAPLAEAIEQQAPQILQEGEEVVKTLKLSCDGDKSRPELVEGQQPAEEFQVYFEPLLPQPTLLIAGAGHIGAALCHIAALLGFEVAVVDDRPSFVNKERLPDASRLIMDDIVKACREFPVDDDTYIVIVTRGHRHDAQVLKEVIHKPAAYIGMIGSRRKIKLIYDEMIAEGVATKEELAKVHSPLGIDIDAESVWEIAVSIAAELVWVRHGCKGALRPLMEKMKPLVLG